MDRGRSGRAEPRLYQQVAQSLRGLIADGTFAPLSRLPAERDLAAQLAVSRPSLREALIALEIDGSVEIRMGSGVYVRPPAEPEPARGDAGSLGESPSELMEARSAIEGAVVVLACARSSAETFAALGQALDQMRAAIADGRSPLEHDRTFHVTIATQAGNLVLARIIGDLFDERHSLIAQRICERFETSDSWVAALAEHEAILAALEAADPLRAEAAMRMHIQRSADRWTLT